MKIAFLELLITIYWAKDFKCLLIRFNPFILDFVKEEQIIIIITMFKLLFISDKNLQLYIQVYIYILGSSRCR
jgi:hypothetical protein